MSDDPYALVEARLEAPVHFADRRTVGDVTLSAHADDPFATRMEIAVEDGSTVWLFGRELLEAGLREPCGEGSVVVVPCRERSGRRLLAVYLRGTEGSVRVDLDVEVVTLMLSLSQRFIDERSCADVIAAEVENFLKDN